MKEALSTTCTHVYPRWLCKRPNRVNVVVEDYGTDHDPQTEENRLLTAELGTVVTATTVTYSDSCTSGPGNQSDIKWHCARGPGNQKFNILFILGPLVLKQYYLRLFTILCDKISILRMRLICGSEGRNTCSKERNRTHMFSIMTLQILAIVLRQSVVFSTGKFLFWNKNAKVWCQTQQSVTEK